MQPKRTKNEAKQQKIKEKREEKDAQQQKSVQAITGSNKLKDVIEQLTILHEPLRFDGPEIRVLTSGSKRV